MLIIVGRAAVDIALSRTGRPTGFERRQAEKQRELIEVASAVRWRWADSKGGLFHHPDCPARTRDGETIERAEALRQGMKPCRKCTADQERAEEKNFGLDKALDDAMKSGEFEKILKSQGVKLQRSDPEPEGLRESLTLEQLEKRQKSK